MLYRLYQPDDFAALYAIEEVCFMPPHRFSRSYMRQLIAQADASTWIAEDAGAMRGFGIVEWAREAAGLTAYVQTLEVLPEARGRGAGSELLRRLECSARVAGAVAIWLHVDAENSGAIRVYQKASYAPRGKQEDYYGRGRPALVYYKRLDEEHVGQLLKERLD